MREEIYRFLSPPERGTTRYRAITAAKEISKLLFITLGILVIARACGNFDASPGSPGDYVILALWGGSRGAIRRRTRDMAPEETGRNREKERRDS